MAAAVPVGTVQPPAPRCVNPSKNSLKRLSTSSPNESINPICPRARSDSAARPSFADRPKIADGCDAIASSQPDSPYRERVGWNGKQGETLRGEKPVRNGVSRVPPGQRPGSFRTHSPNVAGSNPAPATKTTLGYLHCWGSSRVTCCRSTGVNPRRGPEKAIDPI